MSHSPQEQVAVLQREVEALRLEQARALARESSLRAVWDNAPAPVFVKDPGFRYLLVNRRYQELARVTAPGILGKTDFDVFPLPIADLFRRQDEEVVRAGRPLEFEETVTLADGPFTFITLKFPVTGPDGHLQAVGGFCTDITARKRAQEERETLLAQLQSARTEVAALSRILPICASCKRIRDDRGQWKAVDDYLHAHADMEFSHGVCPACAERLYGPEVVPPR